MLPVFTPIPSIRPAAVGLLVALTFAVTTAVEAASIDDARAGYRVVSSVTARDVSFTGPIWKVTQDRIGYLWLLSGYDVFRFDGVHLVELADLRPEARMSRGTAWSLCTTRDGSLWVGHRDGTMTRIRERIVTTYAGASAPSVGMVESLLEGRDGTLWATGPLGLAAFRDNRWRQLDLSHDSSVEQRVTSVFEDHRGNLWVGTPAGVFVRDAGRSKFEGFSASLRSVQGFGEDANGAIWVTDPQHGVRRLPTPDVSFTSPPMGAAHGVQMLTDGLGSLWVATRGQGLWHLSRTLSTGTPSVLQHFTKGNGLTSNIVNSLFEDRDGNIWAGTYNGLLMLRRRGSIESESVADAHSVIATSDGSVWLGTTDGLLRYFGTQRRWYRQQDGLPSNAITAMSHDSTGLIVATDRGLARFVEGRFVPVHLPWPEARTIAMTTDKRGSLWLCVYRQGLFRAGSVTLEPVPEAGLRNCATTFTDGAGRVWTGFSDGVVTLYDGERFHVYSERDGLGGGSVTSIYEDENSTVWFATSRGLSRFSDGRFVSFSQTAGLPSNAVFSVRGDLQGHLWCGVSSAIMRISRSELDKAARDRAYQVRYTLYDVADGLTGSPAFLGASPNVARGVDGRHWFITTDGVSIAGSSQLQDDRPPGLVIETITANGRRSEPAASNSLSSSLGELQINYTAFNFASPQKLRFRYYLEGFDKDWVYAGTRREAIYTNLPAGAYRFRVTASNGGNNWNETSAVWDFVIEPRFYQAVWFAVVCLTIVMASIYVAWRFRVRQIRLQLAIVHSERTRLAREIHDTLLQGLVGVALHFDVIAHKLDSSPAIAKQYLHRVRDEVEHYIREARQSIWNLRSPALQTHDLVSAARDMCQSLTSTKGISLGFVVSGTPRRIDAKAEEHILRICHEAVTNAVRHADAAHIQVELRYSDESVVLRISDDGRGFDQDSSLDNRWGLTDIRERAEQIRARFSITSALGKGTDVEAVVPIRTHE